MPKKGTEEKIFSFSAQDNKETTAYVHTNPKKTDGKMIVFEPFLASFDSDLGGYAICWNIANPKQQFCVLPIKDAKKGEITTLHVWIKDSVSEVVSYPNNKTLIIIA